MEQLKLRTVENKLRWSQSAVKDLENEETCPFRWQNQWVGGNFPSITNEDMDKGKYFEQLLLGSSANAKEKISDLPRLDSGSKSTDQIRIEYQAERGKRMLSNPNDPEYLGFGIAATQLPVVWEDETGVIDIEAIDGTDTPWVIDVKLTKDLTNTRTVHGWGNDLSKMDLMQLVHYRHLYIKQFQITPRLGLLIFDYSPKKRVKFVEIEISEEKETERTERFLTAKTVVGLYKEKGWVKTPSARECEKCPIACSLRVIESKLIRETIKY